MLSLIDRFSKMMNRNNVFRWHYPFLLLLLLLVSRLAAADTLLISGDSLSAGYRMSASQAWPSVLDKNWQQQPSVVNASISGDTAAQGLARLPALLQQHLPRWVLIELGGNDGLRGFPPQNIAQDLSHVIEQVKAAKAQPLLMQIRLPANYGRRYTEAFSAIYPHHIPLLPFFMEQIYMEQIYLKPEWMQQDGIHPNPDAQSFIAALMANELAPLVKQN